MAGELGGRYRLLEVIGSGGMGRVWRADDTLLQRTVAIKELTSPVASVREARAAARLDHPGVVRVYDVLTTPERAWLVMEYVPSRSLHRVVTEDGPLSPAETARIGLRMLAALRSAHAAGVLHRDVKPDNVLLQSASPAARGAKALQTAGGTCNPGAAGKANTPDGAGAEGKASTPRSNADGRVVLTDFGLATICGEGPDPRLGSPSYIAPERLLAREAGVAGDLWSLAATLYFTVEGRPPYTRGDGGAALRALISEPPDAPVLAGPLAALLLAILDRDPAQRPNADLIEQRLREVLDRPVRPRISRRLWAALAGAAMAVAISGGAALAAASTTPPPRLVEPSAGRPAAMSTDEGKHGTPSEK